MNNEHVLTKKKKKKRGLAVTLPNVEESLTKQINQIKVFQSQPASSQPATTCRGHHSEV